MHQAQLLQNDYQLCNDIKWINDRYDADGYYITECYEKNKNNHIFVDNVLCYYHTKYCPPLLLLDPPAAG